MDFKELKSLVNIEVKEGAKIEGKTFSSEFIKETLYNRIWKSANVVKNKRQADKGGVKAIVSQAIKAKLIDASEALAIIMENDKESANALKEQLPKVEKDELPTREDLETAIKQVLAGKGQAS